MPRSRSSGSRSVSTPVSARTSAVLPWSMWPAVPSVSGIVTRARVRRAGPRRRSACAGRAAGGRPRSGRRPAAPRPAAARRGRRRETPGTETATAGPGSSSSGSAPPPTRATAATISVSAAIAAASRSARARIVTSSAASIASDRDLAAGKIGIAVAGAGWPRARRAPSLSSRSARASGCRRAASTASARPARIPACGPPRSLSPEKQTSAAPARTDRRTGGSSPMSPRQHAGADVVDHRHAELAQLLDLDLLHEAELAEVRRVDAEDGAGRRPDRGLVVGPPGAVGRADLDEPGAGLGDHLGHPEAAADLDQLAAGDDHLPGRPGERGRGEQRRPGAVVDRHGRVGAGQLADERLDVVVPRSARAGREVELEVRVALGHPRHRLARGLGQRRAAEVGVEDHAGGVDHAPEPRPRRRCRSSRGRGPPGRPPRARRRAARRAVRRARRGPPPRPSRAALRAARPECRPAAGRAGTP